MMSFPESRTSKAPPDAVRATVSDRISADQPPPHSSERCSTRRFATLWEWEGPWQQTGAHSVVTWERLDFDAPPDARVHLFGDRVTFYDRSGNGRLGECSFRNFAHGVAPELILLGDRGSSRWYELSLGRVVYLNGGWWMERTAWDHTRVAQLVNADWPEAYQR
jgi:hypothetical protein